MLPTVRGDCSLQNDRMNDAIHEAAHAVVAAVAGWNVEHVSIGSVTLGTGVVEDGRCRITEPPDPDAPAELLNRIVWSLAGPVASLRHDDRCDTRRFDRDYSVARDICCELKASEGREAEEALFEQCRARAAHVVAKNWDLVCELAQAMKTGPLEESDLTSRLSRVKRS